MTLDCADLRRRAEERKKEFDAAGIINGAHEEVLALLDLAARLRDALENLAAHVIDNAESEFPTGFGPGAPLAVAARVIVDADKAKLAAAREAGL